MGRSPSHGIALSSDLGSGRNSELGPSLLSPAALPIQALKVMETSLVFKLKGFGNRGQRVEGHMGVCGRADISGQRMLVLGASV